MFLLDFQDKREHSRAQHKNLWRYTYTNKGLAIKRQSRLKKLYIINIDWHHKGTGFANVWCVFWYEFLMYDNLFDQAVKIIVYNDLFMLVDW